jgi:predicted secreted protein
MLVLCAFVACWLTAASDGDGSGSSVVGVECDPSNAHSLGRAVVWTMTVPWIICALIYVLLVFTYKQDRLRKPQGLTQALLQ